MFTSDSKAQCGNGWLDPDMGYGPPPPPECFTFLGAECPRPKFQAYSNLSAGEVACRACLESLGNITVKGHCTMETQYTW